MTQTSWPIGWADVVLQAIAEDSEDGIVTTPLRGLAADPGAAMSAWDGLCFGDRAEFRAFEWNREKLAEEIMRLYAGATAAGMATIVVRIGFRGDGPMRICALPVRPLGNGMVGMVDKPDHLAMCKIDGVRIDVFGTERERISVWASLPIETREWFTMYQGWNGETFNAALRRYVRTRTRGRHQPGPLVVDIVGDLVRHLERHKRKRGGRVTRRARKAVA